MTPEELLDSFNKAFGEKLQGKTEFRGETSFMILAGDLREIAEFCRNELFVRLPARHHQHRQLRRRTALRNGVSPLLYDACCPPSIETESVGGRLRHRYGFGYLADGELA